MAYTFKTEIRYIERSRAPNATNITLAKQAWENGGIVSDGDHAVSFVGDPADADQMKAAREYLASLGDALIGLVPLSAEQIDQIVAVHTGFWTGPALAPAEKPLATFEDFVSHAIETQPELADAKAKLAAQVLDAEVVRADLLAGVDDLQQAVLVAES